MKTNRHPLKKITAMLLSVLLIATLIPVAAFAEPEDIPEEQEDAADSAAEREPLDEKVIIMDETILLKLTNSGVGAYRYGTTGEFTTPVRLQSSDPTFNSLYITYEIPRKTGQQLYIKLSNVIPDDIDLSTDRAQYLHADTATIERMPSTTGNSNIGDNAFSKAVNPSNGILSLSPEEVLTTSEIKVDVKNNILFRVKIDETDTNASSDAYQNSGVKITQASGSSPIGEYTDISSTLNRICWEKTDKPVYIQVTPTDSTTRVEEVSIINEEGQKTELRSGATGDIKNLYELTFDKIWGQQTMAYLSVKTNKSTPVIEPTIVTMTPELRGVSAFNYVLYDADGSTSGTWTEGSTGSLSFKEYETMNSSSYGLKITSITPKDGYVADGCTITLHRSAGDQIYGLNQKIPCMDGCTFTVECPKKKYRVRNEVITTVNGEKPEASTALIYLKGVFCGISGDTHQTYHYTDSSAITATVKPAEGKQVTEVTYSLKDSQDSPAAKVRLTADSSGGYVVPEGAVLEAEQNGMDVYINAVVEDASSTPEQEYPEQQIKRSEIVATVNGEKSDTSEADMTFTGVLFKGMSGDPTYKRIYTDNTMVVATVSPAEGKYVKQVTYKLSSGSPVVLTAQSNGSYMIPRDVVLKAERDEDTIYINAVVENLPDEPEQVAVEVEGTTNGKNTLDGYPLFHLNGVSTSEGRFYTADSAITVTTEPAEGTEITGITYRIGTGTPVNAVKSSGDRYVIPKSAVLNAVNAGKTIYITITAADKTYSAVFNPTDASKISIKKYTPAVIRNGVLVTNEKIGDEITETKIKASESFYFTVQSTDKDYEIEKISLNGTTLQKITDEYTADGTITTSAPYYAIHNPTGDMVIVITNKASAPVAEKSTFELVTDKDRFNKETISIGMDDDSVKSESFSKHEIINGATSVKVRVHTKATTEPDVYITDKNSSGALDKEDMYKLSPVSTEFASEYKNRVTEYSIASNRLAGHVLYVSGNDAPSKKIHIETEPGAVKTVKLTVNEKSESKAPGADGTVDFEVMQYSKATLNAALNDGHQVKEIRIVEKTGENVIKPDAETSEVKGVTFTVKNDLAVKLASKENVVEKTLYISAGGKATVIKDGDTITASPEDRFNIYVMAGNKNEELSSLKVKSGAKDIAEYGVAAITSDKTVVKVNTQNAAENNIKDVSLIITTKAGDIYTVNITVAKAVGSFTVNGFDKNGVAKQASGSTAVYKVTAGKGSDISSLRVVSAGEANSEVSFDPTAGTLTVNAYKDGRVSEAGREITIQFKQGTQDIGDPYYVDVTEPALKAPGAEVKRATDIGMTVAVTAPEALKKYRNMYYLVEANATGKNLADGMLDYSMAACSINDEAVYLTLADPYFNHPGSGAEQAYDITVRLVQLTDESKGFIETNENPGPSKVIKNAKTRNPAYATSFKLVKKNPTIFVGQKNVVAAEAKFDSKATFTGITDATLDYTDKYGTETVYGMYDASLSPAANLKAGNIIRVADDGTDIVVTDTDILEPGTGKLTVTAEGGDNTLPPVATTSITVKSGVDGIDVTVPSAKLYKQEKRAASIKATAKVSSQSSGKAPTKVRWALVSAVDGEEITNDSGHELSGYIKINGGKVTVAKGYEISDTPADNSFIIRAYAADYSDSSVFGDSPIITVTSASYKVDGLAIVNSLEKNASKLKFGEKYNSSELIGKYIVVYGKSNELLNTADYGLAVPSSMKVLDQGTGYMITGITKAGNMTIKAKSLDGKSLKSGSMRINSSKPDGYTLNGIAADGTGISFKNRKGINSSAGSIRLYSTAISDSVCSNRSSVKLVKGGVLIKSNAKNDITILPTAAKTEVYIVYGKETESFTVENTAYEGKGDADIYSDDTVIYPGVGKTLTYTVDIDTLSGNAAHYMELLPADAGKDKAYYKMMDKLGKQHIELTPNGSGGYTADVRIDGDASKGLSEARYKIKAVICSYTDSGIEYRSAPIALSVNAKKAPAVPKATLKTKYTMKPEWVLTSAQGATKLTFSKITPKGSHAVVTGVYNNVTKGQANRFLDYFELVDDGSEQYIAVRSDISYDDGDLILDKKVPASDLKAWVTYTCYNNSGMSTDGKALITIKLK